MRLSLRLAVTALAVVLMAACASVDITHDWDVTADFSRYRTYDWMPSQPAPQTADAAAALSHNTLLDRRIRAAVDAALAARGLHADAAGPDVRVLYHTGIEEKMDITDWGYVYSGEYWGWAGRDIDVQNFTDGTLVVDLVDAETKQLVWRGVATGEVHPDRSPAERDRAMQELVAKMFEKYPPTR